MNSFEMKAVEKSLVSLGLKVLKRYETNDKEAYKDMALFKFKDQMYVASLFNKKVYEKNKDINQYTEDLKRAIISERKRVEDYLYDNAELTKESDSIEIAMFKAFVKGQMMGLSKIYSKKFKPRIYEREYTQERIIALLKEHQNSLEAYLKIKEEVLI